MTIEPNQSLSYIRPDEMAECYDGVPRDLGIRLWRSMEGMKPLGEIIDMEESSPGDAVGINSIASVWHFFTDEEKTQLNAIVEANERMID